MSVEEEPVFLLRRRIKTLVGASLMLILSSILIVLLFPNFSYFADNSPIDLAMFVLVIALTLGLAASLLYSYAKQKVIKFYENYKVGSGRTGNPESSESIGEKKIPYGELFLGHNKGLFFAIYPRKDNNPTNEKASHKDRTLWSMRNEIVPSKGVTLYN